MATYRQLVSDIRSMHRIISTDAMITDRAIAAEIRDNALLLIKRETNLRRLWATDTIFTTISCLSMKEVPVTDCGIYRDDLSIARSVNKLPKLAEGLYQYLIQGVYSVNALSGTGTKLKEITLNRYINLLKLPIIKKEPYYFVNDGYLYVTNSDTLLVRMTAMFEEPISNDLRYPDECDCGNPNVPLDELCMNPLDRESIIPGYLVSQVLDLTSESLLRTYFNIKGDVSSEGIDGQQPNSTPTN